MSETKKPLIVFSNKPKKDPLKGNLDFYEGIYKDPPCWEAKIAVNLLEEYLNLNKQLEIVTHCFVEGNLIGYNTCKQETKKEIEKLKKQLEIATQALVFYRDCCKDESNEDVIIHPPRLPAFRALLEMEKVE